ncbi:MULTISPECIES: SDR family NAD(P)-dependent oxidoreductase [unclassified Sphaerospermopsis]|uniref:SDR family NAD(P)-dependent oxidoreductase n=1 Tax=unclassified Sphaerospermopsis TaxID=2646443 RepID=UPI0016815AE9|nr:MULTISPECIES: SDR family NAD(P)-dependent oxidoreductase [unclassified Sphaerospermopsis]MBD2133404.1 SDR family NAD(P)-dependent oxidoreductase [Sphaerospermopsis sp. FACHB-1094]MBD2146027.1 SDR family NAD(P)-dependent oxidoreductase [Sphaerospermopsis sp. FACHB-1194]
MAGKLDGKVAIITGASSGIGKATAISLAAEGAKVVIAARRRDRLEAIIKYITENGGQGLSVIADITDEAQVQNLIQKANAKFGRVDILVNNAGISFPGRIENADPANWRKMIDINVLGLMYATRTVLPIFKTQKSGHIVNISSVAGRIARAGMAGYNVTKWGVNAFSEALRQEVYQDNIRVTIIEPGLVETEIDQHITDMVAKQEIEARRKAITPLQSEDIAAAIVYAITQPQHVNVNEILIRPTLQDR